MDPSANLRAAIADLKRRRADMDTAITSMEAILASVYGASDVDAVPTPSAPTNRPRRSDHAFFGGEGYLVTMGDAPLNRTEKVRKAFVDHPRTAWSTVTLAQHIGEKPDESVIKSIGAILSRMNAANDIERVGRGAYRLKNASAPGATGAEESGESSSDSPLKEGGSDYDSETSVGRGDLAHDAQGDHGHGDHRAAIGGSVIA